MSRLFSIALLALASPLAFANVMIIRVVIDSAPGEAVTGATGTPAAGTPAPATGEGSSVPAAVAAPVPEAPALGDPARSIVVMVSVRGKLDEKRVFDPTKSRNFETNPETNLIHHKYGTPSGTTFLFNDGITIFLHPINQYPHEQTIRDRHAAWETKKLNPDELLDLALEALAAGMTEETETYCNELLALTKGKSTGISPKVQRFAKAYAEISPKLKAPSPLPSDADLWRDQLATLMPGANVEKQMHYALIYRDDQKDEVAQHLKLLEQNFKNFYLWHALRGEAPKVPGKPLPVILAPRTQDVSSLYRALDARSISTDGFFSAEQEVLVLSPGRLDPVGQAFERMMRTVYADAKTSRAELLKGKGQTISKDSPPDSVYRYSTLALVDRVLQEDAEMATISREGTRQILYAIGALPKHVPLPRWIESGYGTIYEQPRVPVYSDKDSVEPKMTFAMNRGIGAPHYAQMKRYRDFLEAGELDRDPVSRLRKVLNDDYFSAIRSGVDIDSRPVSTKPKDPDAVVDVAKMRAELNEKLNQKAQATAWALMWYLVHEKPAELKQFGQELDRLPHDLPLDPSSMRLAFGRAFKLLQADGQTFDPAAMKSLATGWDNFMNTMRQTTFDVTIQHPKKPEGPMPGMNPTTQPNNNN